MVSNNPLSADTEKSPDPEGMIVLSRRRLDVLFVVAVLVTAFFGIAFYLATAEPSPLLWPLSVAALWIAIRFTTPRSGVPTQRIRAIPGALPLIAWLALMVFVTAGVAAFDNIGFEKPLKGPPEGYQIALYAPLLIIMVVGCAFIEKRYRKAP